MAQVRGPAAHPGRCDGVLMQEAASLSDGPVFATQLVNSVVGTLERIVNPTPHFG